jgi:hypothetical protein
MNWSSHFVNEAYDFDYRGYSVTIQRDSWEANWRALVYKGLRRFKEHDAATADEATIWAKEYIDSKEGAI